MYSPGAYNKGADQTARVRRLVCAFVVCEHQNQTQFRTIRPNAFTKTRKVNIWISWFLSFIRKKRFMSSIRISP